MFTDTVEKNNRQGKKRIYFNDSGVHKYVLYMWRNLHEYKNISNYS